MPKKDVTPRFSYGAKPPVEHPSVYQFADHPAAAVARPRQFDAYAGADLRAVLENDDQGVYGACVGFATAQLVRYALTKAGYSVPPLSPWMVWALTRQQEGTLGQNVGLDPHDALTLVRAQGICRLDLMPAPGANLATLPGQAAAADATGRAGIEFYQARTPDELLTGMGTLGVPGDLCIAVYTDFEQPLPDETIGPVAGDILGYHNIFIRSYDDDKQIVRLHNQWRGWTPDNEVTLTYQQLNQVWSQGYIITHPAAPKPQPQPTPPTTHFVPSGPAAPFWKYLLAGGDVQAGLDANWGKWFHNGGYA